MNHRLPFLAVLLVGLAFPAGLQAATFTARFDRPTIVAGESTALVLEFQGGQPDGVPRIPEVPGLSVSYRGQSSNFQVINGRTSSTLNHTYVVTAPRPGTYSIPGLTANVGGQTLTSAPLTLNVVKTDAQGPRPAFLNLQLPRTEFFVGESAVIYLEVYYPPRGRLLRAPALHADGVTFITNIPPTEARQSQTNGMTYLVATWTSAITFVKAGQFELSASEGAVGIPVRRQVTRPDPFGMDFGDLFGGVEMRELALATEPTVIHVLPLPIAQRPPDFQGAVGSFRVAATLSTNAVAAGDPLTLALRITGTGALDTISWAVPADWTGFKSYPPSARTEADDLFGLHGTRVIEQVLVPENPAVRQVPPIRFSFFDPQQRAYRTSEQPALALAVRPAAFAPAQPVTLAVPNTEASHPARDIVHIKNRPGSLGLVRSPLLQTPWFLGLQLLPVAAWLATLAWRRRHDQLAANPRLVRHRQLERTLQHGFAALRSHATSGHTGEFYTELVHLLQETIGERLDLPASAITGDCIEGRLRPAGLDPDAAVMLGELFELCDQAHYAPQQSSADLLALVPKVEAVLREVQQVPPAP